MYFSKSDEILEIAGRTGCSIFVLPSDVSDEFLRKNEARSDIRVLKPEEKKIITIDQAREVISGLSIKQLKDLFIVICPAEAMGEDTANALLKSLEEPKEKVHFILITSAVSSLMPTILSRSAVYFLKTKGADFDNILANEKVKVLAKKLIAAKSADLPALADEIIPKGKDGARNIVLGVLAVAIEMLYKSYFKTGKDVFLNKIPKYITTYENIEKNGHIKLHLVADLL